MFRFAHPEYLNALYLLPVLAVLYIYISLNRKKIIEKFASKKLQLVLIPSFSSAKSWLKFGLIIFSLVLLIFAAANPQIGTKMSEVKQTGFDVFILLDVSNSMTAQDIKPSRLEKAKYEISNLIRRLQGDRIGLVIFSGESFTQCPLTTDHAVLINLFKDIKQGLIDDGTAIGMGLATAINRIKDSKAKSKVIILLTDGVNNMGSIDPLTAAQIAKSLGIRVYTVGIGRNGYAPFPVQTMFGVQYQNMEVQIDENMLKQISKLTDGKYFRATDNKKLSNIYKEIDKLEKSKIEVKKFSSKNEQFLPFVIILALLLIVDIVLKNTVLRTIP